MALTGYLSWEVLALGGEEWGLIMGCQLDSIICVLELGPVPSWSWLVSDGGLGLLQYRLGARVSPALADDLAILG